MLNCYLAERWEFAFIFAFVLAFVEAATMMLSVIRK